MMSLLSLLKNGVFFQSLLNKDWSLLRTSFSCSIYVIGLFLCKADIVKVLNRSKMKINYNSETDSTHFELSSKKNVKNKELAFERAKGLLKKCRAYAKKVGLKKSDIRAAVRSARSQDQ